MVDFINSKKNREKDSDNLKLVKEHELNDKNNKERSSKSDSYIKRYESRDGLSLSKINWGLFYIEQRQNLITIRNAFFVFFSVMVWGGYAFVFGSYLISGAKADASMMKEFSLSNPFPHHEVVEVSANDISISKANYLNKGNDYDFFALIDNRNEDFYAEFDYYFTNNGKKIDSREGFVLPKENKYLVLLGREIIESVGDVELVIENVKWRRIDKHLYGEYDEFLKTHLDVTVKDKKYLDSRESGISDRAKLGVVEFMVTNNTSFNYTDLGFVIISKYGSKIVDVSKYKTGKLYSNDTKAIKVLMTRNVPHVNVIEVYPEKNIFDIHGYIDFEVNDGIIKK